MLLIYRLAIAVYTLAIRISALWSLKARLFISGRQGLLSHIQSGLKDEARPRIWMHCASLGEFEQGRPLLESLRQQHPHYAIVLTFFSPSGFEVRKDYEGADHIFYLPIDTSKNASAFLAAVRPTMAVFVKYELWYHYLHQLAQRNTPTLLISAIFRPGQSFFSWYGSLQRRMLGCFTQIFVQNPESKALLQRINTTSIVAGDTRFDRVLEIAAQSQAVPYVDAFCVNSKVIVAGSTWPSDEAHLKEVFTKLPKHWKLIIAPHEVHEEHIEDIMQLFVSDGVRLSSLNDAVSARVLVVDSIGKLSALYRYATVAWIGGGFDKNGVHNVLEAAVYGKPCIYGPVYEKYREATDLLAAGGAVAVQNADEAIAIINRWEAEEQQSMEAGSAAGNYVAANAGATRHIMNYIREKNFLNMP